MNKLKLTLSILALTVSQIASAEYIVKVPLEVANGGSLPNGSIIFKNPVVEQPLSPQILDCTEKSLSTDCDERLGAWEIFMQDKKLTFGSWWGGPVSNDWLIINWQSKNITNLPEELYPLSNVNSINLNNNNISNINAFRNIVVRDNFVISSSYNGSKLPADSILCTLNAENKFGPFTAKKNQLCEAP